MVVGCRRPVHRPSQPLTVSKRGAALVEFALLLPLLACLMFGILGYGQYFLIAHLVQQLANDAARATVAGLSASERATLASQSVTTEASSLQPLDAARVTSSTSETNGFVKVTVSYDAGNVAILTTSLLPMPSTTIARQAVERTGS